MTALQSARLRVSVAAMLRRSPRLLCLVAGLAVALRVPDAWHGITKVRLARVAGPRRLADSS